MDITPSTPDIDLFHITFPHKGISWYLFSPLSRLTRWRFGPKEWIHLTTVAFSFVHWTSIYLADINIQRFGEYKCVDTRPPRLFAWIPSDLGPDDFLGWARRIQFGFWFILLVFRWIMDCASWRLLAMPRWECPTYFAEYRNFASLLGFAVLSQNACCWIIKCGFTYEFWTFQQ